MPRAERRALQLRMRKLAEAWPEHLIPLPEKDWPRKPANGTRPVAIWRSRYYLAMLFAAPAQQNGIECRRLTVNRVTVTINGDWEQNIPWEDLQRCKSETGHGDWYGFEIYPRERDVVNLANMRHLWLLAEPLDIGWFAGKDDD